MIIVTRPAGGICLNAGIREVLLNDDGTEMEFETKQDAISFLDRNEYSINEVEFEQKGE